MIDYWQRIGLTGPVALKEIQQAHSRHIPFENLDVLAGRSIRLDADSLWDKLVTRRRGGYCFEQNSLFQRVLVELGYAVVPLAARVRRGVTQIRPHTHMLLRVTSQGEDFLVDVGFGGEGPSQPLPWREGAWELQPGVVHRLQREGELWVLQCQHDEGPWMDLYASDNRPRYGVDYEMYNHYTSTHPASLFRNSMLVGLHTETGYSVLFDGLLKVRQAGQTKTRQLADPAEIQVVLHEQFGLSC